MSNKLLAIYIKLTLSSFLREWKFNSVCDPQLIVVTVGWNKGPSKWALKKRNKIWLNIIIADTK